MAIHRIGHFDAKNKNLTQIASAFAQQLSPSGAMARASLNSEITPKIKQEMELLGLDKISAYSIVGNNFIKNDDKGYSFMLLMRDENEKDNFFLCMGSKINNETLVPIIWDCPIPQKVVEAVVNESDYMDFSGERKVSLEQKAFFSACMLAKKDYYVIRSESEDMSQKSNKDVLAQALLEAKKYGKNGVFQYAIKDKIGGTRDRKFNCFTLQTVSVDAEDRIMHNSTYLLSTFDKCIDETDEDLFVPGTGYDRDTWDIDMKVWYRTKEGEQLSTQKAQHYYYHFILEKTLRSLDENYNRYASSREDEQSKEF